MQGKVGAEAAVGTAVAVHAVPRLARQIEAGIPAGVFGHIQQMALTTPAARLGAPLQADQHLLWGRMTVSVLEVVASLQIECRIKKNPVCPDLLFAVYNGFLYLSYLPVLLLLRCNHFWSRVLGLGVYSLFAATYVNLRHVT